MVVASGDVTKAKGRYLSIIVKRGQGLGDGGDRNLVLVGLHPDRMEAAAVERMLALPLIACNQAWSSSQQSRGVEAEVGGLTLSEVDGDNHLRRLEAALSEHVLDL